MSVYVQEEEQRTYPSGIFKDFAYANPSSNRAECILRVMPHVSILVLHCVPSGEMYTRPSDYIL